ncbi:hypothetical protein ET475_08230 [Microbacterium protaetiae]|uniref:Uncharacterized protein n=1 Tax=Microbacterium protaetiae TaxID=2509458 RepID=A0A4P6EF13_9MICO|nr:hypothetical protein [Microbacterium protaetiae]QAY59983.1 hypothetical protein ET475_08230 [Microbacterium protaetiae]
MSMNAQREMGRSALTPAMKIVIGVVAVIVVAGIITVSALLSGGTNPNTAATTTQQQNGSGNNGGNGTAGNGTPGATAGTSTAPGGAKGAASGAPTIGPLPQATPTTGSEVLPPTATPITRLPSITPQPPLVSAPLPKTASKNNGLVSGYPEKVMGPATKSTVLSSSIATEKTTMQVSLVATTTASQASVQKHYEELWGSLGLRRGTAADGTITYVGAHESVALSFGTTGTGNRYTIYGVFRTK